MCKKQLKSADSSEHHPYKKHGSSSIMLRIFVFFLFCNNEKKCSHHVLQLVFHNLTVRDFFSIKFSFFLRNDTDVLISTKMIQRLLGMLLK